MKLYHNTKVPQQLLTQFLTHAGRSVGARTNGVVVFVKRGRRYGKGVAYYCGSVWVNNRWVTTDGGYFTVTFSPLGIFRGKRLAKEFYELCQHEWAHIRDYQKGNLEFSRPVNGRRPNHDDRPEEIRAFRAVRWANQKADPTRDWLIQEFAKYCPDDDQGLEFEITGGENEVAVN